MPQDQSQLGQFGFTKQAALGAATVVGAAAPARWAKLRSSSMGADRSLMIPDPEIAGAGGRDVPKPYLGPVTYAGDYELYFRSEALPLALYGVLGGGGAAPTGTAAAGYLHTFTPADTLPFFSVQERLGAAYETFIYNDAYINSLHLEVAADGYLQSTLGIMARQGVAGGAATASPGFDATPLIVGSNVAITLGGSSLGAASWSFDYTNNLENDHFVLGSLYADALTPKRRDITGSFTLRPGNSNLYRQAVMGASASTTPGGTVTVAQMVLTATTYEIITGATTAVYTTTVTLPEVVLSPFAPSASGDDVIENSIDFRVTKIAAANAATVTVLNGVSTAYNT